jgi:hypothetical protein
MRSWAWLGVLRALITKSSLYLHVAGRGSGTTWESDEGSSTVHSHPGRHDSSRPGCRFFEQMPFVQARALTPAQSMVSCSNNSTASGRTRLHRMDGGNTLLSSKKGTASMPRTNLYEALEKGADGLCRRPVFRYQQGDFSTRGKVSQDNHGFNLEFAALFCWPTMPVDLECSRWQWDQGCINHQLTLLYTRGVTQSITPLFFSRTAGEMVVEACNVLGIWYLVGRWQCMWHEPLTVAQLTHAYRLNNTFFNDQIDALITFALRTRPGTIQLYYSLSQSQWKLPCFSQHSLT